MRIRHVLPQPAMGILPLEPANAALTGVVNTAWNLATRQAAQGCEVEIVCPTHDSRPQHRRIGGVSVSWIPVWKRWQTARYDFSYLIPLILFTRKAREVDISHVHGNPFLALRRRSRAVVLHYQSLPTKSSPRYDGAVSRSDAVICCSRFIRDQLLVSVDYARERTHVVYNGVDCSLFAQADRASARAALSISDGQIVILYAGRWVPEKGLLVLVEALQRLTRKCNADVVLLVAGSTGLGSSPSRGLRPEVEAYGQQVRQLSAGLPVRFLGDIPSLSLPLFYAAGDIFVCPSVCQEALGMVNVEAAAAGLPVVASAIGGIPEVVLHEQTGLLFPPGEARSLAEALLRLISDGELRRSLGQAGQSLASQLDWSVLTGQVTAIYEDTLNANGIGESMGLRQTGGVKEREQSS